MTGLDRLYDLASHQLGLVTTRQAEEADVSRRMLSHYTSTGHLIRVQHGIYRMTQFPSSPFEDVMQAVLWVGAGAVGSHETALTVYGLTDAMPSVVHITTTETFTGERHGVAVHHAPLDDEEVRVHEGVPVTTPLRTISDVAPRSRSLAEEALIEALRTGLVRRSQLSDSLDRYPSLRSLRIDLTAQRPEFTLPEDGGPWA